MEFWLYGLFKSRERYSPELGGLATFVVRLCFPICLICILIGGGEIGHGNMG